MAVASLSASSKVTSLHSLFHSLLRTRRRIPFLACSFSSSPSPHPLSHPPLHELVNDISRVLSDHRDPHHDLEHFLAAFSGYITADLVEQVLKRCKNLGFSAHRFFLWAEKIPGFQHSVDSRRILVDVLGSSRQFPSRVNLPGDAIRAFGRMAEFGVKPSADDLDRLLYALCKRKHVRRAQEVFHKTKIEFQPSVKRYSILMRGWGDIGEAKEARKLFDEMLERGYCLDVQAYNSLLEALCKGGKVDEAYSIFKEMGSKGVDPDAATYSVFIRAYCEANDLHSVFRVLDRMRRYDLTPNVYTYNSIIHKLCKNEKVEEAYQLLDEMIERGATPDAWSYNAIQAYHCDHNEVNGSLRLLSRMEKENCMPDRHSYNMVLKMLIRVGRFDRVEEVWYNMERAGFYPSVSTYSVMVHGLCKKKGKLEEACKYLEMMIDEGIPPYTSTVEMLRNRLLGLGLLEHIDVLAGKMDRSSSSSVKELANMMRGNKVGARWRREETEPESE